MKYSICFLDTRGCTSRSENNPFENDDDAIAYGLQEMQASAIVEIWKGDNLLQRLLRGATRAPGNDHHVASVVRPKPIAAWENEGGATSPVGVT